MNNRKMCAMRGRQVLKQARSEYGKQIRKEYEGGCYIHQEQVYNSLKSARIEYVTR